MKTLYYAAVFVLACFTSKASDSPKQSQDVLTYTIANDTSHRINLTVITHFDDVMILECAPHSNIKLAVKKFVAETGLLVLAVISMPNAKPALVRRLVYTKDQWHWVQIESGVKPINDVWTFSDKTQRAPAASKFPVL